MFTEHAALIAQHDNVQIVVQADLLRRADQFADDPVDHGDRTVVVRAHLAPVVLGHVPDVVPGPPILVLSQWLVASGRQVISRQFQVVRIEQAGVGLGHAIRRVRLLKADNPEERSIVPGRQPDQFLAGPDFFCRE